MTAKPALHPLRRYRKRHGLTLEQLGARIPTTPQNLHRYEGGRIPEPKQVVAIFRATEGAVRPDHLYAHLLAGERPARRRAR